MESQKVTVRRSRWYDDACGAAQGLEILGERWALLVVRELMFGPRRFSAVRAGLPGISARVLTERLESLIREGVVERTTLPAPTSATAYGLTPWGREAEPIFVTLGRWAARSPGHDPSLPLSAASLMLSFRTMLDAARARGATMRVGFRFGEDAFLVKVKDGGLKARRGDLATAAVTVIGAPTGVAAVVYGGLPLSEAERTGLLAVDGDAAVFKRFAGLFVLSDKAPVPPT